MHFDVTKASHVEKLLTLRHTLFILISYHYIFQVSRIIFQDGDRREKSKEEQEDRGGVIIPKCTPVLFLTSLWQCHSPRV